MSKSSSKLKEPFLPFRISQFAMLEQNILVTPPCKRGQAQRAIFIIRCSK
jgi:hypothetical protein